MASWSTTSRRRTSPMRDAGNSIARDPRRSGVGTWVDHHLYSFVASLGRFARKPWSTGLTVGVMAVALALPLGLWLVLGNVVRFSGDVQQSREISVFLKPQVDAARAQALADELRGRRSEEHTSELQSLMRISYAVFCLKKKTNNTNNNRDRHTR